MISRTRGHVVQISPSPLVEVAEAWPASTFDYEDQVFFCEVGDFIPDEGDFALLVLDLRVKRAEDGRYLSSLGQCGLAITNCYMHNATMLEMWLFDSHRYSMEVDEMRSKALEGTLDGVRLRHIMMRSRVAQSSVVVFRNGPRNTKVVISVHAEKVTDRSVCVHSFSRIHVVARQVSQSWSDTVVGMAKRLL